MGSGILKASRECSHQRRVRAKQARPQRGDNRQIMIEAKYRELVGTIREAYRQAGRLSALVAPKRSTAEGERLFQALSAVSTVLGPFRNAESTLTQPWAAKFLGDPAVMKGIDDARRALKDADADSRTILTGRVEGAKFSDGFEFGMLDPVLILLKVLPRILRDPRSRPTAVQIAVEMKKAEPALSVRKAAETVGITYDKLQRHDLWRAAARVGNLGGRG